MRLSYGLNEQKLKNWQNSIK